MSNIDIKTIVIRDGRVVDPSQDIDHNLHILIQDGKIVQTSEHPSAFLDSEDATFIDAKGKLVVPGLIDLRVSLREPGHEEDETIATGTAAALAGGFTTIACAPDTDPVVDHRAGAEFIILQAARANHCHVVPLGAVTKNMAGEELAEIGQLVDGGALAFTDCKSPLANAEVMRRALEYTRMFGKPIMHFPQVPELIAGGIMNEGDTSTLLGLPGMPAVAESIMVNRDIALAKLTGGRLHLMNISTAESVEFIRRAKDKGLNITADVSPHHLTMTGESLAEFKPHRKVMPPLRSQDDVDACLQGVIDGTLDAISADHQPSAEEKTNCELDQVPFGIIGLETVVPICATRLIGENKLDWLKLIERLTVGPAEILGLAETKGTLKVGADADVTIIDPDCEWTIDAKQFASKSKNTPFDGAKVTSRIETVIVDGEIRFSI